MTAVEVLEAARKLLERPEAWTKGAFARDVNGREVPRLDPRAVCFCSIGAIDRASKMSLGRPERAWALTHLLGVVEGGVDLWNDAKERTHAQVLAAFSAAIEDARKAGR